MSYIPDTASIRDGASQLNLAVPAIIRRALAPTIDKLRAAALLPPTDPSEQQQEKRITVGVEIFAAYVVTNADLYVLRDGVSVAEIEAASSLTDIASPVASVELTTSFSDERRLQIRENFASDRDWGHIDITTPAGRFVFDWLEALVSELERLRPSVFIVKAEAIEAMLTEHLAALEPAVKAIGERAGEALDLRYWA